MKPAGTAAQYLLAPLRAVIGQARANTKMPSTMKFVSVTFSWV